MAIGRHQILFLKTPGLQPPMVSNFTAGTYPARILGRWFYSHTATAETFASCRFVPGTARNANRRTRVRLSRLRPQRRLAQRSRHLGRCTGRAQMVGPQHNFTRTHIVLMGESLGGAIIAQLAAQSPPRGLILENTFNRVADVAAWHYPWLPVKLLMRTKLDAAAAIANYHGPLLQIHGDADTIVPIQFACKLFDAANEPKHFVVIPDGDHNDPRHATILRGTAEIHCRNCHPKIQRCTRPNPAAKIAISEIPNRRLPRINARLLPRAVSPCFSSGRVISRPGANSQNLAPERRGSSRKFQPVATACLIHAEQFQTAYRHLPPCRFGHFLAYAHWPTPAVAERQQPACAPWDTSQDTTSSVQIRPAPKALGRPLDRSPQDAACDCIRKAL